MTFIDPDTGESAVCFVTMQRGIVVYWGLTLFAPVSMLLYIQHKPKGNTRQDLLEDEVRAMGKGSHQRPCECSRLLVSRSRAWWR
ncbi:unnamed protein product [Amoebophrya sp. A25]|nr:unnamed protein product [Amoebophrya sp. A25]|eukprot:GSA25T00012238001.1